MKLHLAWPVSVAVATLVLAGCSSSDSGSSEESSASSSAETTTSAQAAAPSPALQKAADEYKAYAVSQADELVKVVKVFTDSVQPAGLAPVVVVLGALCPHPPPPPPPPGFPSYPQVGVPRAFRRPYSVKAG